MKRALILALASVLTLAFAGLTLAEKMDVKENAMMQDKMTSGANLWKHISGKKPYTNWDLWPGTAKMQKGAEPHGALVTIYVNESAADTISMKEGKFRTGAIVLKENYKPDKTLAAITVMYKAKGYNPESGDWFWVKYGSDGSVDKEGKIGGCIKCHSAKADNDWVFIGEIQ